MNEGHVVPAPITDEIKNSFINYAMYVIVDRALPDVRDGLKPVQRRILYAMYNEGLFSNRKHVKSAAVVGEVMKKYHPHGDSAIYDAMARLTQTWNMRYPLIDGQGNFGSIDGDPPAAQRYTEARMSSVGETMLVDIDKETVDTRGNYDDTTVEPEVLPSAIPNLLVNGASGIAVGMATNIAPHNLSETVDGLIAMIDSPDITLDELMKHIKGPDFPTGGIMSHEGIRKAFETGRGSIRVRGRVRVEERNNRTSLVVTEIPYQVNKTSLIQTAAALVRSGKITELSMLRDESDRQGMRIVFELKRGALPDLVLNQLYKYTQLQSTFSVNNVLIVDRSPRILSLKETLRYFLDHRADVVRRRTEFELRKAKERAHILEGYLIALDRLDEVIALIRASKDGPEARTGLVATFGLSEVQAQAVLEMRLQRLTGLEREKTVGRVPRTPRRNRPPGSHLGRRSAALESNQGRTSRRENQVRRRAPHPNQRPLRRHFQRRPHRRRNDGRDFDARRLHQTHAAVELPRAVARRARCESAKAKRGRHQLAAAGRLDARLFALFHQPGPRLPREDL